MTHICFNCLEKEPAISHKCRLDITIDSVPLNIALAREYPNIIKSTSGAIRIIKQGGIYLDEERISNPAYPIYFDKIYNLRIGKTGHYYFKLSRKNYNITFKISDNGPKLIKLDYADGHHWHKSLG